DMQQAVPAKLRRRRITPPVQQVQLRGLGAPQTPAVDHLEQRRVAVGRQRTLTFGSGRALNLVVGVVQEPLQLPPGKWPGLRAALVLTQVRDRGEVGPGRGAGVATGPFPWTAYPNPTCQSLGIGLSTCLTHWSTVGLGCRFRGPWGRDLVTAVAVTSHSDAGGAGEHGPVVGEPPPFVTEATAEFVRPDRVASTLVLGAYPTHDPAPCEAVDCVEHVLGHGIPEIVRPPAQGPVETDEQLI